MFEPICYLCGNKIVGERPTKDHIPPKRFFIKEIRKKKELQLLTCLTHKNCNESYQEDETYFCIVFGNAIKDEHDLGKIVWESILLDALKHPPTMKIYKDVISGISDKFGDVYLPPGKRILHYDGEKVWRVIRKIIMGLYYKEYNSYLPVDTPIRFHSVHPGEQPPPEIFYYVLREPGKAKHKGLFDYKIKEFPEGNICQIAMLFWDRLIFLGTFNKPIDKNNI